MSKNNTFIGAVIKKFRKQRGLSQAELADGICNKDHLCAIENGKNEPNNHILEHLSHKLNVNLLEYRYDISLHGSLEIHDMIIKLNSFLYSDDTEGLRQYISQCINVTAFKSGEPLLLLLYCKASVAFDDERFDDTIQHCHEAFRAMNLPLNFTEQVIAEMSNVGILIIKLYAITLHTLERLDEAYAVYMLLYNQFHFVLTSPVYDLNKVLHFQYVNFIVVSYNLALLNLEWEKYDKADQLIGDALNLINSCKSINMFIHLLTCRANIYYRTGRIEEAQQILDDIPVILKYIGEREPYEYFIKSLDTDFPELILR